MITNTNRILYNAEYLPAYIMEANKKIRYKGSNYAIELVEEYTDRVYKIELDNCMTTYLSPCEIEVDSNVHIPISRLEVGDSVLTYLDNQILDPSKYNAKQLAMAFLGDKDAENAIKEKYKLKNMQEYKLLRNNKYFLASFLSSILRESSISMLEKEQYINGFFSYEQLQELHLIFSMFGITSWLRKMRETFWVIYFSIPDFLDNVVVEDCKYKVIPVKIMNIKEIKQETQAYKVSCARLVVNTIMIKGDN